MGGLTRDCLFLINLCKQKWATADFHTWQHIQWACNFNGRAENRISAAIWHPQYN